MSPCTIETGLFKKKPCGKNGVAVCLNCEQHLCTEHAVAQLNEGGSKTGKFMCKECAEAAKAHAKAMVGVAKSNDQKKAADLARAAREQIANPKVPDRKPAAPAPAAAAAEAPKPADDGALEFTPSKK